MKIYKNILKAEGNGRLTQMPRHLIKEIDTLNTGKICSVNIRFRTDVAIGLYDFNRKGTGKVENTKACLRISLKQAFGFF